MKNYDHKKIEPKWQKIWDKSKVNIAKEKSQKKFYGLIEFPYPSGSGLHVGHIRSNTAMDIICRKRRREGYNVLYPIGWDAFGLPTENYAIKTGIQPAIVTKKNTGIFRKQLKSLGFSFDWSREVDTTDPKYYKWTQWIFLQMLKNGLAYKKKMAINWCPKDLIGLANEEVINGCCERCGTQVEKKEKEQWMLAITKYADRLDKDLDNVNFLEKIKIQQRNWIGRSEGSELWFNVRNSEEKIRVFTTRPDTLFGVTYLVLSPESNLVQKLKPLIKNWKEIEKYINDLKNKTEIERTAVDKPKNGIQLLGVEAKHPLTKEILPVWIADYVLANYGTGAVMAVPAHDERDFKFAKKYGLKIKQVIAPFFTKSENSQDKLRSDKETVSRKTAYALVLNKKTNKFLCLDWGKFGWRSGIIGGLEEGENFRDAAIREVKEETGYINIKLIKELGGEQHNHFFAAHKDINRYGIGQGFLFELIDEQKKETNEEETKNHTTVWIDADKMESWLNLEAFKYMWQVYKTGQNCFTGTGKIINSGELDGMDSEEAKKKITELADGEEKVTYKLKDWVFSRQRYWGEPIPVVHCEKCGIVPIAEKDLPVTLPKVKNYKPTETGESPLAAIEKWVNTKCPKCRGKAKRETDTMPNWAGSSWYYLRYADPKNSKEFASKKNLKYWTAVDWYNGGMEHTTLHLLYSRFWHKFLFDLKLVPTSEPYQKRTSHGMVLAEGGEKMSKSKGNVINPDEVVKNVGADTLRIYEMFMGPFDQSIAWETNNIAGSRRFLERVWKLQEKIGKVASTDNLTILLNKTIKKVSEDIEEMRFNTATSSLMILANEFEKTDITSIKDYEILLKLLAPFAPHITEEIWANLGHKKSIHLEKWPVFDPKKIVSEMTTIVVQINGKARVTFDIKAGSTQAEVEEKALKIGDVTKWLVGKQIKKKMFIKEKILAIITD